MQDAYTSLALAFVYKTEAEISFVNEGMIFVTDSKPGTIHQKSKLSYYHFSIRHVLCFKMMYGLL
jgi:hypothetical protein